MEPVAGEFTDVVVGEVVDCAPHPDADKLRVCQVDTGAAQHLQIVCGASNVRAGMHVAAALIGACLPGDFKIKQSKLRGVQSFGMLCAASELGLEESGGALISDISPGAAQDAGIRRGDIVLMFDGVEVKNAEHLRELIEAAEEKRTVAVLVRRGDNPLFMALRLPG